MFTGVCTRPPDPRTRRARSHNIHEAATLMKRRDSKLFAKYPIPVLQFTNTHERGGAEEHILTLLRGFDRKYFRLHLVCHPIVATLIRRDVPADVELLPLELCKPTQMGAFLRLARILRDRHIRILHSHMFFSSMFSSPVGW